MFILTKIKQIILLFGDIALLFLSLYITLSLRYGQAEMARNWQIHFFPFALAYLIWILVFYSQNLYNLNFTKNNLRFFRIFLESLIINLLIATFFFYFTPFFGIAPKTNLFLNAAVAGGFLIIWRGLYNLVTAQYIYKNKIAFLGYSKEVGELMLAFEKDPQLGYETACIVSDEEIPGTSAKKMTTREFMAGIKNLGVNTIAIHYGKNLDKEMYAELYKMIFSNITFINLLKLYEEITAKLPIETLSEGWFLDNLQESEKKVYDQIKIIADYALGLAMGLILAAIFIPVALLILITSGRPVFYTQTRVGKNGKEFKIFKFRTMVKNAENGSARFAEANDSRITGFGKFLRQTRIDELPQIINVLRGEMSFIGPRPERPEFTRELAAMAPFYPLRHLAKPGLTGWAQISYDYAGTIEENLKKLQYDIFYIKNRSFLLDATIILKTFNIILRFRGR